MTSISGTKPSARKPRVHLVCNAHLDPVWLWQWEDGLATTLATFRAACDFCERYQGFVFNHNEALLYEWVERHDAALFRRIRELVKKGSWHIAGGAFLQPDVNLPCGETHIRQYLYGKRYFKRKFHVEPTTAYNFDPFGHPEGFVQILAGCGIRSYIFCRPDRRQWPLPVGSFRWRDRSGAEVVARRSDDHYLSNGRIYQQIQFASEHYRREGDWMLLWGIGNHGGGPSMAEMQELARAVRDRRDLHFLHSTPEAFFKHVVSDRAHLPVVTGEFQRCFEGCYTSMSRLKRAFRHNENLMQSTEALAAAAWWIGAMPYPAKDLEVAWKDLLFATFHDILPGSGSPQVERDSLKLLGHCEEILRRIRAKTMLSLTAGEKRARPETVPIFVFNPHGFAVRTHVEVQYNFTSQFHPRGAQEFFICRDGKRVPSQREKESTNMQGEWVVRAVLPVSLDPFGCQRLDACWKKRTSRRNWKTPGLRGRSLRLSGRDLHVTVNLRTGLVDRIKVPGLDGNFVTANAFQPLVMKDLDHSWDTVTVWKRPLGRFRLATRKQAAAVMGSDSGYDDFSKGRDPVHMIEKGPVRTVLEAIFVYNGSYIVQRYIVYQKDNLFELDMQIFWAEKDRMLKLALPTSLQVATVHADAVYGRIERPADGHEEHNQKWIYLAEPGRDGRFVGVVNRGTCGHSVKDGTLRISLLRSPPYGSFSLGRDMDVHQHRYLPRQDQGEHRIRLGFLFHRACREAGGIDARARVFNMPPQILVHYGPEKAGRGKGLGKSFLEVTPASVHLVALKKAEGKNALVVRIRETAGRRTSACIVGLGRRIRVNLGPYQIKTLMLVRRTGGMDVRETDLIERPVRSKRVRGSRSD